MKVIDRQHAKVLRPRMYMLARVADSCLVSQVATSDFESTLVIRLRVPQFDTSAGSDGKRKPARTEGETRRTRLA